MESMGSVGCGGGWGADLTNALNTALNQDVTGENGLALGQRRDLWRFCDGMTDVGAGWDTATTIGVADESNQNTSYAPAELFGQADIARSIANWQMNAVATRVQQNRLAIRNRDAKNPLTLARRRTNENRLANRPLPVNAASTIGAQGSLLGLINTSFRSDSRSTSVANLAALLMKGLSSGDDVLGVSGLGVFLSGRYVRLEADSTRRELGGDTDGGGFTLGADYRLGDAAIVGLAFGYNHYDTEFSGNAGDSQIDDFALMLFGSHFLGENFYVDGTFRASYLLTDTSKRLQAFDGGPGFADQDSDPNGYTLSADLGMGAEFDVAAFMLNPYVRLNVYHTNIEDYSESGGDGSLSLVFEEQDVTSLPVTVGGTIGYNFSTSAGVFSPYVRAEYLYEFLDQAAEIEGFLKVIPSARFELDANSTDRHYGTVGAGATLTLRDGWSGFVDYDALIGFSDLTSHTATLGIRKEL